MPYEAISNEEWRAREAEGVHGLPIRYVSNVTTSPTKFTDMKPWPKKSKKKQNGYR